MLRLEHMYLPLFTKNANAKEKKKYLLDRNNKQAEKKKKRSVSCLSQFVDACDKKKFNSKLTLNS